MNVKRFSARTAREALALVRQALGEDAVVLSTKPSADGVEVLAMAPEGMQQAEAAGAQASVVRAAPAATGAGRSAPRAPADGSRPMTLAERIAARGEHRLEARAQAQQATRPEPRPEAPRAPQLNEALRAAAQRAPAAAQRSPAAALADIDPSVAQDVETLGMSTLTFQDYVRERMLRRRQAELEQQNPSLPEALAAQAAASPFGPAGQNSAFGPASQTNAHGPAGQNNPPPLRVVAASRRPEGPAGHVFGEPVATSSRLPPSRRNLPVLREEVHLGGPSLADEDLPAPRGQRADRGERGERSAGLGGQFSGQPNSATNNHSTEVMGELRQVRHLIEERFGMLAYMERMQRDPRQVSLLQKLFDTGLSPGMVRKLAQALPADVPDEMAWAATVLERNLLTGENDAPLEDHHGVLALIGPTGVGKTTTTAKIAAAFAAKHGAANLGLITLDAYRVGAHEQLRTYGRILGVPVHTAHDRASLEDLMELLSSKQLVLIDTAGVAQRDTRTRELLEMLSNRAIEKLLVVNAAVQGETVEDVMLGYGAAQCLGVILSKLDEAVKLGPALDALIRQRGKVLGVTNGQRVPEDWHRLTANALVQRALRGGGSASWRLDANEVNLVFAATHGNGFPAAAALTGGPSGAHNLHA